MKYLVDSDWLIDFLNGRQDAVEAFRRLANEGVAVSILSVAELYEGAEQDAETSSEALSEMLSAFTVLTLDDATVRHFARIRRRLRREGRAPPDIDLLIAATALRHNLAVITRNVRHFERVPGLKLFSGHPAAGQ